MGKSIKVKLALALSGAVALVAGAIGAGAQSSDPQAAGGSEQHASTHRIMTGGPITYKQAVTNSEPQLTSTLTYQALPLGNARVQILAGKSALINVRFTAESRCREPGGAGESNWCEVRILIGGIEGFPRNSISGSPLAFDSTSDGTEGVGSWESHSTESHRCLTNTGSTTLVVPVQVEWRVTNLGGDADVPEFWLDDWSLVAERSDRCTGEVPAGN